MTRRTTLPFRRKVRRFSPTDPCDVLVCPITGRRVWMRDLWNGDGAAREIVKTDHNHTCPACCGEGSVEFERAPRNCAQVDMDTYSDQCAVCEGRGTVDAIYTYSEDPGRIVVDPDTGAVDIIRPQEEYVLLWPKDEDDAIMGIRE